MINRKNRNDPARTYTLDDFIKKKISDDMTYHKFSILEVVNGIEHLDHNLVEEYLPLLEKDCVEVKLDYEQMNRYKYCPDLLAYDIYGSIQLDFVILLVNDMIDPKEFIRKTIKLPRASTLSNFMNRVYRANTGYINYNRTMFGLSK